MHLMTALELKKPGILFRGIILLAQGEVFLFFNTKIYNALVTVSIYISVLQSSISDDVVPDVVKKYSKDIGNYVY